MSILVKYVAVLSVENDNVWTMGDKKSKQNPNVKMYTMIDFKTFGKLSFVLFQATMTQLTFCQFTLLSCST